MKRWFKAGALVIMSLVCFCGVLAALVIGLLWNPIAALAISVLFAGLLIWLEAEMKKS